MPTPTAKRSETEGLFDAERSTVPLTIAVPGAAEVGGAVTELELQEDKIPKDRIIMERKASFNECRASVMQSPKNRRDAFSQNPVAAKN
jgi:hypothetical protein